MEYECEHAKLTCQYCDDSKIYGSSLKEQGVKEFASRLDKEFGASFVVKDYEGDDGPTIKGNGFDGIRVGESRDEALELINWINSRLEAAGMYRVLFHDKSSELYRSEGARINLLDRLNKSERRFDERRDEIDRLRIALAEAQRERDELRADLVWAVKHFATWDEDLGFSHCPNYGEEPAVFNEECDGTDTDLLRAIRGARRGE